MARRTALEGSFTAGRTVQLPDGSLRIEASNLDPRARAALWAPYFPIAVLSDAAKPWLTEEIYLVHMNSTWAGQNLPQQIHAALKWSAGPTQSQAS